MNGLEPLWYEVSPYLYGFAGVAAILLTDALGEVFGILLLTAAATIVGMRKSYRELEEQKLINKKPRRVRG